MCGHEKTQSKLQTFLVDLPFIVPRLSSYAIAAIFESFWYVHATISGRSDNASTFHLVHMWFPIAPEIWRSDRLNHSDRHIELTDIHVINILPLQAQHGDRKDLLLSLRFASFTEP